MTKQSTYAEKEVVGKVHPGWEALEGRSARTYFMRFLKPAVFASGAGDRITDNNAKAGEMSMKLLRVKLIKDTIESENFGRLRGSTQAMFSPGLAPSRFFTDILGMLNQSSQVLLC
jgi:hypothetical protein